MKELDAIINRHQIPVFEVKKPVMFFSTCYGCGVPIDVNEREQPWNIEYCSHKCYCEVSCIDRDDG